MTKNGNCQVTPRDESKVFVEGFEKQHGGLYEATICPEKIQSPRSLLFSDDWHARMGHVSKRTMEKTLPMVKGVALQKVQKLSHCETCKMAKSTCVPRPSSSSPEQTQTLELLHIDLVGPMSTPSLAGCRYLMLVYDDCTAFSIVNLLRTKCEAPKARRDSVKELDRIPACRKRNFRVGRIRSNNSKEFATKKLNGWLDEKGIVQEVSAPYSPESNGKAESLNGTAMDMARTLLASTGNVPNKDALWAEAVYHADYLRNRLHTSACSFPDNTPYEAVVGIKPKLGHIRKF